MIETNTDFNFPEATLKILDKNGRPAEVDGVPEWATSDATVLSVTPSADGKQCSIDTVGVGVARISVKADADRGAGVEEITKVSDEVNVTLGPSTKATDMVLDLGTPVAKVA